MQFEDWFIVSRHNMQTCHAMPIGTQYFQVPFDIYIDRALASNLYQLYTICYIMLYGRWNCHDWLPKKTTANVTKLTWKFSFHTFFSLQDKWDQDEGSHASFHSQRTILMSFSQRKMCKFVLIWWVHGSLSLFRCLNAKNSIRFFLCQKSKIVVVQTKIPPLNISVHSRSIF